MKRHFLRTLILPLVLIPSGCSRWAVSRLPESSTAPLLAAARRFKDERPLQLRAGDFEDRLYSRFGLGDDPPWLTLRREFAAGADPFDPASELRKGTVADAALFGGRYLASQALKMNLLARAGVSSAMDADRFDRLFRFIQTLCEISGEPGVVVRGVVPKQEIERGGWSSDLTDFMAGADPDNRHRLGRGSGMHESLWFYGDASPGQYSGVAGGLYFTLLYGPRQYSAKCRELLAAIGKRLVANDCVLLEPNGEKASVYSFGYGAFPLLALPDFHGGAAGLYSSGGGYNRGARILTLMAILRACAAGSGDGGLRDAYLRLCGEGYARAAGNAPFDFFGFVDGGQELAKAGDYLTLLAPAGLGLIDDAQYRREYRRGLDRLHALLPGAAQPAEIFIREFLAGGKSAGATTETLRAIDALKSFPSRKLKMPIVNSNRAGIELNSQAQIRLKSFGLAPLARADETLPLYEQPREVWTWIREPRALDSGSAGDKIREEYPAMDFLFAYWIGRFAGAIDPGM